MGRKSVRENKTIYLASREAAGYSCEAAAELVNMSRSQLYRIETGETEPSAHDVIKMGEVYHDDLLCNRHCTQMCPIGQQNVFPIERKDIAQITVEILDALNRVYRDRDRLLEILVDGKVTEDEKPDFQVIHDNLEKMSKTIDSLKLWVDTESGGAV